MATRAVSLCSCAAAPQLWLAGPGCSPVQRRQYHTYPFRKGCARSLWSCLPWEWKCSHPTFIFGKSHSLGVPLKLSVCLLLISRSVCCVLVQGVICRLAPWRAGMVVPFLFQREVLLGQVEVVSQKRSVVGKVPALVGFWWNPGWKCGSSQ